MERSRTRNLGCWQTGRREQSVGYRSKRKEGRRPQGEEGWQHEGFLEEGLGCVGGEEVVGEGREVDEEVAGEGRLEEGLDEGRFDEEGCFSQEVRVDEEGSGRQGDFAVDVGDRA